MDLQSLLHEEDEDELSDMEEDHTPVTHRREFTYAGARPASENPTPDENDRLFGNRSAPCTKSSAACGENKNNETYVLEDGELEEGEVHTSADGEKAANDNNDGLPSRVTAKEHETAVKIGRKLGEKKLHLLRQVVAHCGISFCLELLEATLKVEANGGMLRRNSTLRRDPGGVFLTLLEERIAKEKMKRIRDAAKPEEKRLKQSSRQKAQRGAAKDHG
eukprot:CAMPEP_0118946626 /NCGR_PEP_ID=MMETSP1169-20130426/44540_1 /TAXON_ID=36882 /ORGANISM="Pyramimonas obovata, Strain CCMP722" /LENGTH=218 /DNA_ID=CAMNT_0006892647 /DNA_START=136 /DNA_END=788 /DNA_ORIENTATION=-